MMTLETNTVTLHGLRSALVAASCSLAACIETTQGLEPSDPPDSPTALIQRLSQAEDSQDYGALLHEIPPSDRTATVYMVWFGAAYDAIGAEPREVREYRDILDQYLLDEDWLNRDATGPDGLRRVAADTLADQPLEQLFADLMALGSQDGGLGSRFGFSAPLHELDVEDDLATALIGESRFTFVRSKGTWYWRFLDFDPPTEDA